MMLSESFHHVIPLLSRDIVRLTPVLHTNPIASHEYISKFALPFLFICCRVKGVHAYRGTLHSHCSFVGPAQY